MNIHNFIQLTPMVATSGQPLINEFEAIARAGYKAVINLSLPSHERSLDNEGNLVTALGMSYFHIPVPFDNPKVDQVRVFCNLMECLDEQKVWVHCIMNYRVSVFMYHYLTKVKGWNKTNAMSPIFTQWDMDETWKAMLLLELDDLGL